MTRWLIVSTAGAMSALAGVPIHESRACCGAASGLMLPIWLYAFFFRLTF
jgi:hypothetical protein